MRNRAVAVINDSNENSSQVSDIVYSLALSKCFEKIVVFTKFNIDIDIDIGCSCNSSEIIEMQDIPSDKDTRPKVKNYVTQQMKQKFGGYMLHVIEDRVKINKNPNEFIIDIENIMDKLDLNSYFGTITDTCNYVYSKYNPRLNISIDNEKYKKLEIDNILFCSHSNVQWVIFDLSSATDAELYFDEEFTIDMFWIIEYLAQRRNVFKDSLYFMNQYITCQSEYGVYSRIEGTAADNSNDQQRMAIEDKLFKSKNIDFSPTNNIDMILEKLYSKLNSKI